MNMFVKWFLVLIVIYIGWMGSLYFLQEKLIFYPSQSAEKVPVPAKMPVEEVFFETSDGVKLQGFYVPTEGATETVLFFHGNAGNVSYRFDRLYVPWSLGKNALIFDYRGYGLSEGEISNEVDLYLDGAAALDFLVSEKGAMPENVILWGRSLGAAVALELATKNSIKKLILESPFLSIRQLARERFWWFPSLLVRYQFDNKSKISEIEAPLLIFHSEEDETVPFAHGKKLLELASEPKELVPLSGEHNGSLSKSFEVFYPAMEKFLEN
jgi:fermentation-respiration switch protein FrsA (DUF1100 family)